MEIARRVLRNILAPASPQQEIREEIDEEALQREIDAELVESPRLAEAVIEERYEDR